MYVHRIVKGSFSDIDTLAMIFVEAALNDLEERLVAMFAARPDQESTDLDSFTKSRNESGHEDEQSMAVQGRPESTNGACESELIDSGKAW